MRSRLGLILSIAVLVVGATGAVAVATGGGHHGGGGHNPPHNSVQTFEFVGYGHFGPCTLLKLKAPLLALLGIETEFPEGKNYCFKTITF